MAEETKRNWTKVVSQRLDAVDYDPMSRTLYVRFPADKNGEHSVYAYANYEPAKYQELVNAPSLGKYFNANIINHETEYPYKKIGKEKAEPEEPTAA